MIWSLKTGLSKWAGGSDGKESTCNAGDSGLISGSEDPLEKGMATHSSILAWRIPWMEDPGGLQSMGLQRVGHDWVTEPFHFNFPNFCTFSSLSFLLKNWTHSFLSPPFSWKPLSNIAKNHRLITFWPFRNTGSLDTWVVMGQQFDKTRCHFQYGSQPLKPPMVLSPATVNAIVNISVLTATPQFSIISMLALGQPLRQADSQMSEGWHIPAYGTVLAGSWLVGEDTRSFTHPGW